VYCFLSDLPDLSYFIQLSEVVDCFLAPTELHRDVVQSAVLKPMAHVPESVDPIALVSRECDCSALLPMVKGSGGTGGRMPP